MYCRLLLWQRLLEGAVVAVEAVVPPLLRLERKGEAAAAAALAARHRQPGLREHAEGQEEAVAVAERERLHRQRHLRRHHLRRWIFA